LPRGGVLRLTSGDYVAGNLADSDDRLQVAWQNPQFDSSLIYKIADIQGAYFPSPKDSPLASGEVAVEFHNGDILYGKIAGSDDQTIELENDKFGSLSVTRNQIRRVYRWNDGDGVTAIDCGNLAGWEMLPAEGGWTERGGNLQSDKPDARLWRDVSIAAKSRIEIEIAWQGQPNFVAAFGVDPADPGNATSALRIEVWDKQVVAVWEEDDRADIGVVGNVDQLNQQLRLAIDLDQAISQATLFSDQGQVVATLKLKPKDATPMSGFVLYNLSGEVMLSRLQVTRGDLETIGEFTSEPIIETLDPQDAVSWAQLRTFDGIRLTGTIESIRDQQVTLRPLVLGSTVAVPMDQIGRLSLMTASATPPHKLTRTAYDGIARLESTDIRLHGSLIDVPSSDSPITLRFQPIGASEVTFLPAFSGRLVYQDPLPKVAPDTQQAVQPPKRNAGIWDIFSGAFGGNAQPPATGWRAMHLRTGEVIPCDVKGIDENGVTFKSNMTDQTLVPQHWVRALQLLPGATEPVLDQLKRERLLTVPRMRKSNPPTHLIVATNGDVMRCRLKRLTDDVVEVETRLETIEIDRKVVSQILWLDTVAGDQESDTASASPGRSLRAIMRDGNVMSLVPHEVQQAVIAGHHEVLGSVRIDLKLARELLIGDVESLTPEETPYRDWRLADAPEPTIPEDGDGQRLPGGDSPLVGKPAPDFSLDLLGGGRFKLSEQRGKVVVLDFWATWCGPCMQAMPMIEETVKSFQRDDILLVAVNLQETEAPIRAVLERLKLDPQVALDIDGVAAARYQANAIPQTVVIDQQGTVHRLFVGGGAKLGPQLAEAIKQLVDAEAKGQ
jgi:thiol-disulfide isomerase/thioredoxin